MSAGPERAKTAPPATRDKPLATRLTTFLFYFCSCPASPGQSQWRELGALDLAQEIGGFQRAICRVARADTADPHVAATRSRPRVARSASSAARRGRRDDPVAPRPDRQRRHRRLVLAVRDRRLVDRVAGDPLVQLPHIVLRRGSPENGEPKVTTARTRSGTARASSRANSPPRLQPTTSTGASSRHRGQRAVAAARSCRRARPMFQPCRHGCTRHPAAASARRSSIVVRSLAMKPGMTSAGAPSTGPRGP